MLRFNASEVKQGAIPTGVMGVYFFLNQHKKIIYIGKSIDVKKRLQQHLYKGRKRLLHFFAFLEVKVFSSELESLLYESQQIKKHRPIYNRKLRKTKARFFLHSAQNEEAYSVFRINTEEANSLMSFASKHRAIGAVRFYGEHFQLCDQLNGLEKGANACFKHQLKLCLGACVQAEAASLYNERFSLALAAIHQLPRHCLLEFQQKASTTFVEIENHRVKAYGVKTISHHAVAFPSNDELKIVQTYAKKHPYQLLTHTPQNK
jgi:DNA polymerase-3 subunit epsilon